MPKKLAMDPTITLGVEEANERDIAAYEALADVLDSLGESEALIRLNRRGKTGGMEFCEQVPADASFGPQYIKENWGGGVYSVQLWGPKPGETGVKYLKQVTVKIAGVPKEKKEPEAEPVARIGSGIADASVIALQIELATVKGMLAGMQTKGGGDGSNPLDNLEKLTTIVKNMMPPPAPAGGMGAGEVFGIVRDVMNLSKEMAPEGGGSEGTPWGMIIDKAVEPAIALIGQALAAQKAGQPMPGPTVPDVVAVQQIPSGAPMWQAELAKIVPRLLRRARDGKDPALAADLFLEDAPGGVVEQLDALVDDPQFVPTVLALAEQNFPDVVPVRGWVGAFLEAVKESLIENREQSSAGKPTLTVEEGGADAGAD